MTWLYAGIAILFLINAWAIHGALVRLAAAIEAQNRAYGIGEKLPLEGGDVVEPIGTEPTS